MQKIWLLVFVVLFPRWSIAMEAAPCATSLLGYTVLQAEPVIWSVENGWSNRGALGADFPERNAVNDARARRQGVHYWGTSIAVAKSVEAASAHDISHTKKNTGRVPYIITDIDVSDLNPETPVALVQARFRQILTSGAPIIEFEDAQKANGKKLKAEKYTVLSTPDLLRLNILDKIFWLDSDDRGARFHFPTYVYPKLRGVVEFTDILKRNSEGAIANREVRKMFRDLIEFIQGGGTVSFNTDFAEALEFAKNQWRAGPTGEKVQNSRFMRDPTAVAAALLANQAGKAFSVEARNSKGQLVAGEIVYREGNLLAPDTIFHWVKGQDPENPEIHYAAIAKAVSIAEAIRFMNRGIPIIDIGMMTPLSEEEGGKIISGVEFSQHLAHLNSQPDVDLHLNEPFSLNEFPFPMSEVNTWVPPRQAPPAPKKAKL